MSSPLKWYPPPALSRLFQGSAVHASTKLDSEPERPPDRSCTDLTLKREFENLFQQFSQLGDGFVDIEVRHSAPFKLVLERRYKELL